MILAFLKNIDISDDDVTIMRIPGNEKDIAYNFDWQNFKLHDDLGNEISLIDFDKTNGNTISY